MLTYAGMRTTPRTATSRSARLAAPPGHRAPAWGASPGSLSRKPSCPASPARPCEAGSTGGSPSSPTRSRATRRHAGRLPERRPRRAGGSPPRSAPSRPARLPERADRGRARPSQDVLEDLDRPAAVGEHRDEREAEVPLAGRPEVRTRRNEDAVLEQARGERLRALVAGNPCPEAASPRSRPAGFPCSKSARNRPASHGKGPHPLDVLLVFPGDDRRPLHELLGAVPTDGRNDFIAATSAGSPAAKPER